MSISNKSVTSVTEEDLKELIANQVAEGKVLDYKVILPGGTDDDKKEFLADVSSFANTIGGHLIFGMDENEGIASSLPGVTNVDPDKEKLRLESIIRDGVAPRIARISIHPISLQNGNHAFVIQVPQSWSSPHVVTYKNWSRFFARNSGGKYQMDVHEIRQLVLLSESTSERIKNFRLERLSHIIAGDVPIPIGEKALLVIHSIPLSAFQSSQPIDIKVASEKYHVFFANRNFSSRFNLDGILLYLNFAAGQLPPEYLQVFRNSHAEYVNGYVVSSNLMNGTPSNKISINDVETDVIKILKNILAYQQALEVEPPILVFLSLLRVKGFTLDTPSGLRVENGYFNNNGVDRDDVLLPEVSIDNYPLDIDAVSRLLQPIFDALWNSAGFPRSFNYDESGAWHPRR